MSLTGKHSRAFLGELYEAEHDVTAAGAIKALLMAPGFVFTYTTSSTWADIEGSQIAAGNGYTQDDKTLTTVAVNVAGAHPIITCDDISWTATGGAIADTIGVAFYSDLHASKTVIGYVAFGTTVSISEDATLTLDCSSGIIQVTVGGV